MTDLLHMIDTQPWMRDASCAGVGGNFWFPDTGGICRTAHDICAACPVRDACLAYALAHPDLRGTWGGLSEHQRDVLTGRRAA